MPNRRERSWIMGAVTIREMNIESAFAGLFCGASGACRTVRVVCVGEV